MVISVHLELVTIMCSNLYDLLTPRLIVQLKELKRHMGLLSFKDPYIKRPVKRRKK